MNSPPEMTPSKMPSSKMTVPGLRDKKLARAKITALTAYDYPTALILEEAGIDVVLVGDSLANAVLGYDSTLPVTMEEMLVAVRSVRRGLRHSLLVADMPFGSYQGGEDEAVASAVRFVKTGAEAVKLEGGRTRTAVVRRLVDSSIPVMGHIGLTPQSVHVMGGYKVQGRGTDASRALIEDALALEHAGAFAVVLEGIPAPLAGEITVELQIPTIGIGAGPHCDGQILVLADVLGLTRGKKPKFVRRYLNLHEQAVAAVQAYSSDVLGGTFPAREECYDEAVRPEVHRSSSKA